MITSVEEFVRLRTSERKDEYDRAAHEEAPIAVWWQLVRDHPDMKRWVAHNKTIPLEILEALSTDEDADVRYAVAMKRKASPEILDRLARDVNDSVRLAVAYNAKTPTSILEMLLADAWDVVVERAKERLGRGK